MNERSQRVIRLSDRGRGLEWLSLGFGLWLVSSLVVALLLGEATASTAPELDGMIEPSRALVLAATAGQLVALAVLGLGLVTLFRCGQQLWFGCALAALAVLLISPIAALSLPWFDLGRFTPDWSAIYGVAAGAEVFLVAFVLLGIRALAGDDEDSVPVFVLGAAIGAEVFGWVLVGSFPFDEEMLRRSAMLPSVHAGLVAVSSLAGIGLVLLAIRAASRLVRAQIWSGDRGVTSPARAADWQRTAGGLERFGGFLIGKIAMDAAAMPLLVIGLLTGSSAILNDLLVPVASALCSAGMIAGLVACRRVPDPPDARAGFTGAAVLIAACLAGELYVLSVGGAERLTAAVSSLGHLVAYLAFLRSTARVGERLGDDDLTRRAGALGKLAVVTVPAASISGYLLLGNLTDLGDLALWIAVPIAVAGVAFAALLPCALLARELATRLRGRFAAPPAARASFLQSPRSGGLS